MRFAAMSEYHEPTEELDDKTRDEHRALKSLQEELEAADWYQQRIARCKDPDLKRILQHNRNEELEHASMLVEWLRRKMPEFHAPLAKIAFTELPLGIELDEVEAPDGLAGKRREPPEEAKGRGLGVGSLRRGES